MLRRCISKTKQKAQSSPLDFLPPSLSHFSSSKVHFFLSWSSLAPLQERLEPRSVPGGPRGPATRRLHGLRDAPVDPLGRVFLEEGLGFGSLRGVCREEKKNC
jgi:hypothetical protein